MNMINFCNYFYKRNAFHITKPFNIRLSNAKRDPHMDKRISSNHYFHIVFFIDTELPFRFDIKFKILKHPINLYTFNLSISNK